MLKVDTLDIMQSEEHFISVVFLSKSQVGSWKKKKNLTNPIEASFTKYLTNISQNLQGYYHKQSLKNYHSYEEHKKNMMIISNVVSWIESTGPEKESFGKTLRKC